MTKQQRRNALLIALAIFLLPPLFWAGNFISGRAVRGMIPPMTLSFFRWVIAFVVLLPLSYAPMRRDFAKYRAHAWLITRISLTGVVAFNALVYLGLRETTASNGILLNSFIPVLIVMLGAVIYRQSLRFWQMVGLVISCMGVVTVISQGDIEVLRSLSFSRGDLVVFAAMVSFAFYTLWLRQVPADIDRRGLLGVQIAIALVFLLPLCLWELQTAAPMQLNTFSLSVVAYVGVFPSVAAYLLYNLAVARFGAARAGLSIHLIPVFGVALAVAFLGESVQAYHVLGIGLIVAGLTLAARTAAKG